VISARWGREQAARARDAIAGAHGHGFKLAGEPRHAWPGPERLLAALDGERVIGLPGEKLRRLHGVATAAAAGELDAARFTELAEAWRPFRTWATVLLRVAAERDGLG